MWNSKVEYHLEAFEPVGTYNLEDEAGSNVTAVRNTTPKKSKR